ncbi:MAG: hypothetical protein RBQ94_02225 [Methanimicrococcus sp.]|nr:hypothetical protein [Methanimicrococcus sp.]
MNSKIKKIGAAGFILCILGLLILFIYIYAGNWRPKDLGFAVFLTIIAQMVPSFYYMWKKESPKKQKNSRIAFLIMVLFPMLWILFIFYCWQADLPPVSSITDPMTAVFAALIQTAVFFLWGIMYVIGAYHTDEIIEKLKSKKEVFD